LDLSKNGADILLEKVLSDKRVNLTNKQLSNAFLNACANGHIKIAKTLLEDWDIDPCFFNNGPIHSAILNDEIEIVKMLLEDGRVDPTERFSVQHARKFGTEKMIKVLCKYDII